MKQKIVTVEVPYAVEIVRRGCRKAEGLIVWDQGPVAIIEADGSETSVAFNIGSRSASEPAYDILSFDGRTWWPLRDGPRAMSVDAFLGSLSDPDGCFLATLNLSPATLYSSRAISQRRFDADHTIRQVDVSSRDRRWTLAHLSASRLLFCGGAVYMEGSPPAYFGIWQVDADAPTLSLRIGRIPDGTGQSTDRWRHGPSSDRLRCAVQRSLVFSVIYIDDTCTKLKAEGIRPV